MKTDEQTDPVAAFWFSDHDPIDTENDTWSGTGLLTSNVRYAAAPQNALRFNAATVTSSRMRSQADTTAEA